MSKRYWLVIAVPVTLAMAMIVPANASTAKTAPLPVNVQASAAQSAEAQSATENYWTPERMAAAIPLDQSVPTSPSSGTIIPEGAVTLGQTVIGGTPGSLAAAATTALRDPVQRPYSNRYERMNGKVFFTRNGGSYVCSGTIVNSENKDLVDTAGHCVAEYGVWSSNMTFVPGYNSSLSNPTPYGKWTARDMTTRTEWLVNWNLKQDLGYLVLNKKVVFTGHPAVHIANWLGGQGTYFNISRTRTFDAFGYPQAAPFTGADQRLSISTSSGGGDNPYSGWVGPNAMRINSRMTGGSSGGGWLINISMSSGLGYVNGHNDYKYISGPKVNSGHMYSPYYGSEALSLFNFSRSR